MLKNKHIFIIEKCSLVYVPDEQQKTHRDVMKSQKH